MERRVLLQPPNSCRKNTSARYTQLSNNLKSMKRMRTLRCMKKKKRSKLLLKNVEDHLDPKKVRLNQLQVKPPPRNKFLKEVASQEARKCKINLRI